MAEAASPVERSADRGAVRAFLIPTPTGAWQALAPGQPDARRSVVRHLLRDGARRAPTLEELCAWTGCSDSREARTLLFRMQRDGWLSADVDPLQPPHGAVAVRLPRLLGDLSDHGQAFLADDAGLCVAAAGLETGMAERLASLAPVVLGLCRAFHDGQQAEQALQASTGSEHVSGWRLHPLDLGRSRLFLAVRGALRQECEACVELAALLLRRYAS